MDFVKWMERNNLRVSDSTIVRQLDAGVDSGLDTVLSALRTLTERHVVLRTRFSVAPIESATQVIRANACLDIRRLSDGHHSNILLMKTEIAYGGGGTSLDPEHDAPICLVHQRADLGWGCILIVSHMAVDGHGAALLAHEYQELVAGSPAAGLPATIDPLIVRDHETRPEGVARSVRNVARMRSILRHTEADQLLIERSGADGAHPTASKMRSERFSKHVHQLSSRYGVPESGIVAALVALLIWREYRRGPVLLWLLHRMPTYSSRAAYVATNTISTLAAVDIDSRSDVGSFLRRTWVACVNAFRIGSYDPLARDEMLSEVAHSHGYDQVNGLACLNFHAIPDAMDWGPLTAPVDDEMLEHRVAPELAVVYRSYFDVKMATRATTIVATGVPWPTTGDTAVQCRSLIRFAELMANCDDGSADLRTLLANSGV